MHLYHVSPTRIRGKYLRTDKSKGRLPLVWLTVASGLGWAVEHIALRHNAKRMYLYTVQTPRRADLIRFRRGIWMSRANVRIRGRVRLA